jgi:two-component system cell cycle response regulator DivK
LSKRVLVVEDNELNLKLFCDLLRAHDYTTEPVRDGREAVERARAFAPDLIVMDIQLPYVSGLELIETCKADAELSAIPIMAVTAYAGKEDEDRVRAAGAEAYVSKPISLMRFIGEVVALTPREVTPATATTEPEALPEEEAAANPDPEDALPEDEPDTAASHEDLLPEDVIGQDSTIEGEVAAADSETANKAELADSGAPVNEDAAPTADSPAAEAGDEKPI